MDDLKSVKTGTTDIPIQHPRLNNFKKKCRFEKKNAGEISNERPPPKDRPPSILPLFISPWEGRGGGGRLFGRLRWVHLEPPNKVRLGCRHSILHYFVGTAILVLSGLTQLVPALHMEVPFENATSKPLDTKSENSDYIVSFPVADSFSIFGERKNVSCDFRQRFR